MFLSVFLLELDPMISILNYYLLSIVLSHAPAVSCAHAFENLLGRGGKRIRHINAETMGETREGVRWRGGETREGVRWRGGGECEMERWRRV
jgi:hypothetical protein